MQMRNQEPLPPSKETNNNTNLSFVKSSMSTNTSFTISKCPQIEEGGGKEEEEDDFGDPEDLFDDAEEVLDDEE